MAPGRDADVKLESTVLERAKQEVPRTLREADWRFLLPPPAESSFQHLVLIGGSAGLAERVLEERIAKRVTQGPIDAGGADVVIVLHRAGEQSSIEAAARMLAPGGALYFEIDRRSRSRMALTPRRAHRALRRAGLTPTGTYWVRPTFELRQMYLPLHSPGPLRWYLGTTFAPVRLGERVLRLAFRARGRLRSVLGDALVPRFAVTAVAGSPRNSVASWLAERALETRQGEAEFTTVLVTNGADDRNRVVLLPFAAGSDRPAAALKLSRLPELNTYAISEQGALEDIRDSVDESIRAGLPAPLGVRQWGDIAVGAESYLPGRQMAVLSRRRGTGTSTRLGHFDLALSWLAEFNRQAQPRIAVWSDREWAEQIQPDVDRFRAAYGLTEGESDLIGRLEDRSRALNGVPIPFVWRHYAYAPWNIVISDGRIGVFDWEGAEPALPLFDLIYFATHWYEDAIRPKVASGSARSFRELFCVEPAKGSIAAIVDRGVADYEKRVGLDPRFRPILLTSFALSRAVSRLERIDPALRVALDRSKNPRIDAVDALVQHRDYLFEVGVSGASGEQVR